MNLRIISAVRICCQSVATTVLVLLVCFVTSVAFAGDCPGTGIRVINECVPTTYLSPLHMTSYTPRFYVHDYKTRGHMENFLVPHTATGSLHGTRCSTGTYQVGRFYYLAAYTHVQPKQDWFANRDACSFVIKKGQVANVVAKGLNGNCVCSTYYTKKN